VRAYDQINLRRDLLSNAIVGEPVRKFVTQVYEIQYSDVEEVSFDSVRRKLQIMQTGLTDTDFFNRPAESVARDLLGMTLLFRGCGGVIVETEAYHGDDPASHSYRGQTPRNGAMFGKAGRAYVYRSYGMHWCLNVVCEPASAVLLRALAPTERVEIMRERRGGLADRLLCSGPGRLTAALGVTGAEDGVKIVAPPFDLLGRTTEPDIVIGPRIGITKAVEAPLRFGVRGSPYLSKPFRQA
jgi:DNA-3-methyladenine glycosylase